MNIVTQVETFIVHYRINFVVYRLLQAKSSGKTLNIRTIKTPHYLGIFYIVVIIED